MYYRRSDRKERIRQTAKRFLLVGGILLLIALGADRWMRPVIQNNAAVETARITSRLINQALQQTLLTIEEDQRPYVILQQKADGTVSSVQLDSAAVSKAQTVLTDAALNTLSQLEEERFSITLGTLLFPNYLSDRGPKLSVALSPSGYAVTRIASDFSEMGINQTRHRLIFQLTIQISCAFTGYRTATEVTSDLVLCDTIIVGDLPEYYTKVITESQNLLNDLNDYAPGMPDA